LYTAVIVKCKVYLLGVCPQDAEAWKCDKVFRVSQRWQRTVYIPGVCKWRGTVW